MTESARHVTADTATYQDYPEQGDSHGWQGMNEQTEAEMNKRKQSLAPVRPTAVMAPLQGQEHAAGYDGGMMPEAQASIGHQQQTPAEQHGRCADMPGTGADTEPAHGPRGSGGIIGSVGRSGGHFGFSRRGVHTCARDCLMVSGKGGCAKASN